MNIFLCSYICILPKYHFLKIFIYLFVYLFLAASGLSCGTRDLSLQHAGSFVAACGLLSSCGEQATERTGSVVAARGISCPATCGIFVRQPGIESTSPALEGGFLTTGPPGKSLKVSF